MAHDVFLSYSYQDKAAADAVCHSLEAKGVRCWIAPRDVIPGEDWQQSILDAIASTRAVILLFTAHTNQSDNVKKEVSAAFDANAMVIPFRIEDVSPQGSLTVDAGAATALRSGKSLLPAGVRKVEGRFGKGDAVVVLDAAGREVAVS